MNGNDQTSMAVQNALLKTALTAANNPETGMYGFTVQQSKGSWTIWIIIAVVICCLCYCCLLSSGALGGYYYYNRTPAEKFTSISEVNLTNEISIYWNKLMKWFGFN